MWLLPVPDLRGVRAPSGPLVSLSRPSKKFQVGSLTGNGFLTVTVVSLSVPQRGEVVSAFAVYLADRAEGGSRGQLCQHINHMMTLRPNNSTQLSADDR